jgi:hypothetical protein
LPVFQRGTPRCSPKHTKHQACLPAWHTALFPRAHYTPGLSFSLTHRVVPQSTPHTRPQFSRDKYFNIRQCKLSQPTSRHDSIGIAAASFTPILDADEWPVEPPSRFTPSENCPIHPLGVSLGGPQGRSGHRRRDNSLAPSGNRTPSIRSVTRRRSDWPLQFIGGLQASTDWVHYCRISWRSQVRMSARIPTVPSYVLQGRTRLVPTTANHFRCSHLLLYHSPFNQGTNEFVCLVVLHV